MADVTNPEEQPPQPVEDERTKYLRINGDVLKWTPPENELDLTASSFDTAKAWNALLTLPSCQELMIREGHQKRLSCVVGVNVTQEFPWIQIPFKELRNNLFDDLPNGQMFHNAFQGVDVESVVLMGYVPLLTQDVEDPPKGDPFVLYVNPGDAKLALAIIRNLEKFERLMINKRLVKQPRKWVSYGSEDEVNLTIAHRYHEPVDVEIESVYPLKLPAHKHFKFRWSNDVRDGYVELIPLENARFENVSRRRITVGIQSSFSRKDIEQQTDPTFPTNAWAQYLYEIKEDDDCLDDESEDEEANEKQISKPTTPEPPKKPKPPPEISDNIKFLLKTLESNQIDMYRNDYPHISNAQVTHYTSPYIEETLCFANIAKSYKRLVSGYDWYPALAGLIVTSYTFCTAATVQSVGTINDLVQQAVLQPHPILMWSFNDNLNYKLEFESPLDVVALSFCPYEANVLLGGANNGQIILWDLQNRAEKLDTVEMLSSAQIRYRVHMNEYLKWTIQINEDMIVIPATLSTLENSQKAAITGIQWLGRHCFVNSFGKVYVDPDVTVRYRYFMTYSLDGTIAFWNLDGQFGRKASGGVRKDLPKALTQNESSYKGKVLMPIFTVAFSEPLTAIIADTPVFKCQVKDKPRKNPYNYAIQPLAEDPPGVRQSCITSSMYGRIERISWLGQYADANGREVINTSISFARVHDGPVISMKKNPFFPWLFVSIGRNVFAVWKEDFNYSPIFWRKRQCDLTAVAWSEAKPSVLFLTRIDGSLEAWDLLSRDDDACFNETIGGGIVTNICEHKPFEPEKLLGIGDYNSSLRMIKLPKNFYKLLNNEIEDMKAYILNEESRKKHIQSWEQKYDEKNKEIIEAKRQAERDTQKEVERIEKETGLAATRKLKEKEDTSTFAEPALQKTYTERMKKQWYELNLNRLLSILMSRKQVNEKQLNEQTGLEKARIGYEVAKKESLAEVLRRLGDEVATIRSRIHPLVIPDLQRNDMIQSSVQKVMEDAVSYEQIESEANEIIEKCNELESIDYSEFLHRGEQRRKNINKSLGGNTERLYWYNAMKEDKLLSECNWGFETFADLLLNAGIGSRPPSDLSLIQKEEKAAEADNEDDVE